MVQRHTLHTKGADPVLCVCYHIHTQLTLEKLNLKSIVITLRTPLKALLSLATTEELGLTGPGFGTTVDAYTKQNPILST